MSYNPKNRCRTDGLCYKNMSPMWNNWDRDNQLLCDRQIRPCKDKNTINFATDYITSGCSIIAEPPQQPTPPLPPRPIILQIHLDLSGQLGGEMKQIVQTLLPLIANKLSN